MKKKILFINQSQFGYHIDYFQYCNYLKLDYDITFICWDYNRNKIVDTKINVIYVSRNGNILKRNLKFLLFVLTYLKQRTFSFVFINYFRGASFIALLRNKSQRIHLDIRTASVTSKTLNRFFYNKILWFESLFFKSVSIISKGLRSKLKITKNALIIPLGANKLKIKRNCIHDLHLLYVGTLSNRKIEDTIEGFSLFLIKFPKADIQYTIIGDGWNNEKELLSTKIKNLKLSNYISLKGYIPNEQLIEHYKYANVGVSYIPITPYFEFQPPTKTFEYLLAGMPVIATSTYENSKIINKENGLLIGDNSLAFSKALEELFINFKNFDEIKIRKSVKEYQWSIIVKNLSLYITKSINENFN